LEGSFIPLSLEMAVDLCVDILNLFSKAQIPIIRMGLQSTDEIAPGKSIVAGPFHPAFRELVEAENYRRLIEKELGGMASPAKGVLNITCNDRECSKVSGVKQSNKLYFKEKYGFTRVIIKGEKYVDKGRAIVEILK
jgi:histone acetyltransferase (RNA polymerase elongator complex component)